ncbi:MAG TPA: class I SAM-dependent methyltransferase [Steroidobacteraceae bacterium]|jgi:2-polyprenyl-3-methyl-5-hydroxy-6-metoxy-1,4-benzoquinol methylase|nr:class I SAM-dependent methyltransferase [Steroidobacteraceae bacterium]
MTLRGAPAPLTYQPSVYWEDRARRFAAEGEGLAAVCSYGMPEFYNRLIHVCQRLALAPWLRVGSATRVLDVGCGVGRWSRLLAARGAQVTGVDLSPTMIAESQRRAAAAGLTNRCRFVVQDTAHLHLDQRFDLVLGVTVLQHILDAAALRSALQSIRSHLAPGGRIVLLEAAPTQVASQCNTSIFKARLRGSYVELFEECGLRVRAISGVDPAPFKTWLLPYLPRLSRPLSVAALALVTALSAPIDALFGRIAVQRSWHAVFVLERAAGG